MQLLKSKVHRACVTAADVAYEGSLGIDQDFMDAVGLLPFERILCGNLANGHRFETYAIPAPRGSMSIILNGAVAHLGKIGDRITIMSFASITPEEARTWVPRVIVMGPANEIVTRRGI